MSVLLKKPLFEGVSNKELVQQLEGQRKCKVKLPSWYSTPNIFYPNRLAIEQSSSESAAVYKSHLITGNSLLDLTGGFGVDSLFFSKSFSKLTYCERQEDLAEISRYNFEILGANNIEVHAQDGLEYLKDSNRRFDAIYLDPSRRSNSGGRIFLLSDTEPPLPDSLSLIWSYTDLVLIKTSPLLDIAAGLRALGPVKEVHVVAVDNEVKELLWILHKGYEREAVIKSVNIRSVGDQVFAFRPSEEKLAQSSLGAASEFLYEPNSSLMKAGPFQLLGERLGLLKLHTHTHIYSSETLIEFPGKRYQMIKSFRYRARDLKRLNLERAHIISRNFPESVEQIRKKFRLKDGGDKTLIFTRETSGALVVLLCSTIQNKA